MAQSDLEDKHTIVLLGRKGARKSSIGENILKKNVFTYDTTECQREESRSFVVINTPDLFEEDSHTNQNIIDCMALSYPGPHLFILVIKDGQSPGEVTQQVKKLKGTFGKQITANMIVLLAECDCMMITALEDANLDICKISDLKTRLKALGGDCRKFKYTYNTYSKDDIKSRKTLMEEQRKAQDKMSRGRHGHDDRMLTVGPPTSNNHHENDINNKGAESALGRHNDESHCRNVKDDNDHRHTLNIVLLGQTGTGKSASGNLIMKTNPFKSYASSVPVTRECQQDHRQIAGTKVRVIDTPDFYDENIEQSDKHLMECRGLCQPESSCVYLLVIQIGRFTEGEREILNKLEKGFESEIREKTIVLFTHGEDLKPMSIETFLEKTDPHLKEIVRLCGERHHVFSNTSTDRHQVMELMEKICKLLSLEQMLQGLQEWKIKHSGSQACRIS